MSFVHIGEVLCVVCLIRSAIRPFNTVSLPLLYKEKIEAVVGVLYTYNIDMYESGKHGGAVVSSK